MNSYELRREKTRDIGLYSRSLGRRQFPAGFLWFGLALTLVAVVGPNWPLALLATGVLMAGIRLLWRPAEPPILLFGFFFSWLQASVHLFVANLKGVPAIELRTFPGDVNQATLLSIFACMVLAVGLRLGAGRWRPEVGLAARMVAQSVPLRKWFLLYLAALGISTLLAETAAGLGGLRQILLALASFKWAFFWMLAYATFVVPRPTRWFLGIAFGIEFLLGFSGYFSGFKTVFFVTFMALVAAGFRVAPKRSAALMAGAVVLFIMGAAWAEIKMEYRAFVSGYTGQQVVVASPVDRYKKLMELASEMDGARLSEGLEKTFSRIAYVEFFGAVLTNVPERIPHEYGALWWDALSRPFMPRLFFPNKKAINDSELVNHYTDLNVAGVEQGTSISLGYVAETYIDFGYWLMYLPLFALGWTAGRAYRWYLKNPASAGILGTAIAVVVLLPLAGLETSIIKLVGALMLRFLASLILIYFLVPRFIPWIQVFRKPGK